MRLLDFIEQTNCAATPGELTALFKTAISDRGYNRFAYGALTNYSQYKFKTPFQPPAVILEYPPDWVEYYFDKGYENIDPIISRTPVMRWPFLWNDLPHLSQEQRRFMDEAKEAGLGGGVCVPLHGPFGDTFAMSYGTDHQDVAPREVIDQLHVIAAQFHTAFLRLAVEDQEGSPLVRLTPRETECLIWTARGKSSWDIGMILNISEHTASFHIKNAMAKLQSSTRILAIVKALRMGLIIP